MTGTLAVIMETNSLSVIIVVYSSNLVRSTYSYLKWGLKKPKAIFSIAYFTVLILLTWPLIGSEAGGDLVMIQTSTAFHM